MAHRARIGYGKAKIVTITALDLTPNHSPWFNVVRWRCRPAPGKESFNERAG
jgi:hypothetical protein